MLPGKAQQEAELLSADSAAAASPAAVNGQQNGHGSIQRVLRSASPLSATAASPPVPPAAIAPSAAFPSSSPPPSPSKTALAAGLMRPLLQPRTFLQKCATLALCVIGIYVCFISYGLLQERIYKQQYGPEQEKFNHAWFLVLIQIAGNIVFSGCVPPLQYLSMSMSYIGGMLLSNWALSYLSYPAQSLAKSCKLIPVMLMRIVINRAVYELRDYVQVALITGGISVFMLYNQGDSSAFSSPASGASAVLSSLASSSPPEGEPLHSVSLPFFSVAVDSSWVGLFLCLVALVLDGYTGPSQERVCTEFGCSMSQLMFNLNLFCFVPLLLLLAGTAQLTAGLSFALQYPHFMLHAALFSLFSALGQCVVLYTLLTFNSLVLTTITTTRKFATILLSVALYGHILSLQQWTGVGLVFLGLWMDVSGAYHRQKQEGGWLDRRKRGRGRAASGAWKRDSEAARDAEHHDGEDDAAVLLLDMERSPQSSSGSSSGSSSSLLLAGSTSESEMRTRK